MAPLEARAQTTQERKVPPQKHVIFTKVVFRIKTFFRLLSKYACAYFNNHI